MQHWLDTAERYGTISRINHWLGAAAVIAMLAIGLYFSELPRGDRRSFWLGLHISLGVLLFIFLFFRVSWRALRGFPRAVAQRPALQRLAAGVHRLLLVALGTLILTGPFIVWTKARPLEVFDWFALASPLPKLSTLHEILENVHVTTAYVLIGLVALHLLGVARHALQRDGAIRRMWG
jgi:cytochrome b561